MDGDYGGTGPHSKDRKWNQDQTLAYINAANEQYPLFYRWDWPGRSLLTVRQIRSNQKHMRTVRAYHFRGISSCMSQPLHFYCTWVWV